MNPYYQPQTQYVPPHVYQGEVDAFKALLGLQGNIYNANTNYQIAALQNQAQNYATEGQYAGQQLGAGQQAYSTTYQGQNNAQAIANQLQAALANVEAQNYATSQNASTNKYGIDATLQAALANVGGNKYAALAQLLASQYGADAALSGKNRETDAILKAALEGQMTARQGIGQEAVTNQYKTLQDNLSNRYATTQGANSANLATLQSGANAQTAANASQYGSAANLLGNQYAANLGLRGQLAGYDAQRDVAGIQQLGDVFKQQRFNQTLPLLGKLFKHSTGRFRSAA